MNVATILFAKSGVDIITEVYLDESHPYSKSQMFIQKVGQGKLKLIYSKCIKRVGVLLQKAVGVPGTVLFCEIYSCSLRQDLPILKQYSSAGDTTRQQGN